MTSHSYNYVSRFLPFFNIPIRLDNLFQRIFSVYHRFEFPFLNESFDKKYAYLGVHWIWK